MHPPCEQEETCMRNVTLCDKNITYQFLETVVSKQSGLAQWKNTDLFSTCLLLMTVYVYRPFGLYMSA